MKQYFATHLNALVMLISFAIAIVLPFITSKLSAKVLGGISRTLEYALRNVIGSIMVVVIFVVMGVGIFARYFLRSPILWSNELVLALYVGMAFFMSATNMGDHKEVTMDFIFNIFGPILQSVLTWIFDYIQFALCIYIFYFSVKYTQRIRGLGLRFDTLWGIPWWILYLFAPIGFFCASMFLCIRISNRIQKKGSKDKTVEQEKGETA